MYEEDDLLPLSALQHLAFCERQCGLMYVEGLWADNRLTVEGSRLHDRSHEPEVETRAGVRIARGLRLRSLRLGLSGQADVVEFHRCDDADRGPPGASLPGVAGLWRPFPVEHKRGRPKPDICDEVQLCAQALCLEEMLGAEVPAGALYYGQPRRRKEVTLGPALRAQTEALALRLHELVRSGLTPAAHYERKCRGCSLLDVCLPKAAAGRGRSARHYLAEALAEACEEEPPDDEAPS